MSEIADVVCCSAVEIIGERHLMPTDTTIAAGIEVPSTSPIFLAAVGLHVLMGLACVVAGVVAMLSPARQGRHPTFGAI